MKSSAQSSHLQDGEALSGNNVASQIENIIEKSFPTEANSKLVRQQIADAVSGKGNKQKALFLLKKYQEDFFKILPENLKTDEDILQTLLREKPQMFFSLNSVQQSNTKLQDMVLGGLTQVGAHIGEILEFLSSVSQKNSQRLQKIFQKSLSDSKYMFRDSLSEIIYKLYMSDSEIFQAIKSKNIFQNMYSSFAFSKTFTSFISQKIKSRKIGEGESETSKEEMLGYILEFLGIGNKKLSENICKFIELLTTDVNISKVIKQDDSEQQETENQEQDDENTNDTIQIQDSKYQEYLSVGTYSYVSYSGNSIISDLAGRTVNLKTNILTSMSEKSLENFMSFSLLMQDIGLGFLISKYSRLLQIATDVNLYEGNGMTDGRILKLLNSVGRTIGIPQSSYSDTRGNTKTRCFQTLDAAKMHFREVRSSGSIGDFYQDPASRGNEEIVEIFMKQENIISQPYGELSLIRWGNIKQKKVKNR